MDALMFKTDKRTLLNDFIYIHADLGNTIVLHESEEGILSNIVNTSRVLICVNKRCNEYKKEMSD